MAQRGERAPTVVSIPQEIDNVPTFYGVVRYLRTQQSGLEAMGVDRSAIRAATTTIVHRLKQQAASSVVTAGSEHQRTLWRNLYYDLEAFELAYHQLI